MAGFSGGDDDDVIAAINVTPLVDITLVLLIIFMVTTSYIVKAQIEVNLPRAASGQSEVKSTLTCFVDADGKYYLDGAELSLAQLGAKAKAAVKADPEIRAVIAADQKVEYDRVIALIDEVKVNGIEKFALNIVRKGRK